MESALKKIIFKIILTLDKLEDLQADELIERQGRICSCIHSPKSIRWNFQRTFSEEEKLCDALQTTYQEKS